MSQLSAPVFTKAILSLCGVLAAVYFGLLLFLHFWQTRLIFFPSPAIAAIPADIKLVYEEVWLPVATGRIQCWWIPAATEAPVLLYLHGNSSNIGDTVGRAQQFHHLASVLLIDYRGYGLSSGTFPSEASVYEDAEAAWIYLTKTRQIAPKDIVLYGHSLGGAIAIQLAAQHLEMGGVIVEGTFTSIRAMIDYRMLYQLFPVDWILTQRFDSLKKVRSLQTPILFIHGTADETVPAQMSRELFAAAPQPKQLLLIPKAGHNNTASLAGTRYLQVIQEFVQKSLIKD